VNTGPLQRLPVIAARGRLFARVPESAGSMMNRRTPGQDCAKQ